MATMTRINHTDLAFFNRLASLTSDRHTMPPAVFFQQAESSDDHEAQYDHMLNMIGMTGINLEDDYFLALEHIIEMARHDGIKLRMWDVIHATGLSLRVDATIAAGMILGSVTFVAGEWFISVLLPF